MASNTDVEMRWVTAWDLLLELVGSRRDVLPCQLPDGRIVGVEECKAWLQSSVYKGYLVRVEAGWVGHQKGVLVSRTLPGE
jgi:hypothetical protein